MASAPDLRLSADHARRFLVRRHLLDPPRSLPARPASVLRVVDRLGGLQFDPIEVPGARAHDLVLHARIRGFQRGWTDRWLYAKRADRRLIELYNKSLNMVPIDQLPHYRVTWERNRDRYEQGILTDHADLANSILDHVRREGPTSTDAFRHVEHRVEWWWDSQPGTSTRAAKAVMESLFVTGKLGIARREGSRRYYDLIERLVPPALLAKREPFEAAMRHRMLSRFQAVGLTSPNRQAEVFYLAGSNPERQRWTAELVDEGVLTPVAVDGLRDVQYLRTDEMPVLEATRRRSRRSPGVAFVAALDPIAWDRRKLRELWGFEYLWEIYVPAPKRRWGYYVLPMLFGERFVGRIEPRLERATRTLRILGIAFEEGFSPMEEPHFVPALAEALEAYRSFVGADSVRWPTTRLGRQLASAVRAV